MQGFFMPVHSLTPPGGGFFVPGGWVDALIIALVKRLAAWVVGAPFFARVLSLVAMFDGRLDLDGDGKKEAVWKELEKAGVLFGKRQFNRALEWALVIVERKRA